MKIIELLNLVYEKKAPKKILYKYCEYEFNSELNDYQNRDGLELFSYLFNNEEQALFLEVEILEDKSKKIEKITMCTSGIMGFDRVENITCVLKNKLNEIIDIVNYLLEKSDKNE